MSSYHVGLLVSLQWTLFIQKKKNFMISESGEKQEKALNNDKNIYISRQDKKKRKQPKKKERILQGLYSSLYSTSDQ